MSDSRIVRVSIELDMREGKEFPSPDFTWTDDPQSILTYDTLLKNEAIKSFIYWLDSWCEKKKMGDDIQDYIQAKVVYDG